MIAPARGPAARTPSSGVIIELLFLCATALSGVIGAVAIERARRSPREPRPTADAGQAPDARASDDRA